MKILLHGCCAPCLIHPCRLLENAGNEVTAIFFNPNIMPYREFRKRLTAFREYAEKNRIPLIMDETYSLETMLKSFLNRGDTPRCLVCYNIRLEQTAKVAKEKGFDAFTTTLSVSPYQNHELIGKAGENAARIHNIRFLYQDFTEGFKAAHQEAQNQNLYLQSYCGCIFSEEERYRKSKRMKDEG